MSRLAILSTLCLIYCGCQEGPETAAPDVVRVPEKQPPIVTMAEPPVETQKTSKEDLMPTEPAPTEFNPLNDFEKYVILEKGTERAWVGEYTDLKDPGTYICRRCNAALYKADSKFHSDCGWPSFDDEIDGAVVQTPDADGTRTEITCKNCGGHLGHVFSGEGYTEKNTRHCVNSVSMKFIPEGQNVPAMIKPPEEK